MTDIGLNIGLYLLSPKWLLWISKWLLRISKWLLRTPTKTGTKGICLCKQETHVENSSRTIVKIIKRILNPRIQTCAAHFTFSEPYRHYEWLGKDISYPHYLRVRSSTSSWLMQTASTQILYTRWVDRRRSKAAAKFLPTVTGTPLMMTVSLSSGLPHV